MAAFWDWYDVSIHALQVLMADFYQQFSWGRSKWFKQQEETLFSLRSWLPWLSTSPLPPGVWLEVLSSWTWVLKSSPITISGDVLWAPGIVHNPILCTCLIGVYCHYRCYAQSGSMKGIWPPKMSNLFITIALGRLCRGRKHNNVQALGLGISFCMFPEVPTYLPWSMYKLCGILP